MSATPSSGWTLATSSPPWWTDRIARKKKAASEFNKILGLLVKSAAVREATERVRKDTFAKAARLASQVRKGELTMARATAILLTGLPAKVLGEAARVLPRVLLGGSHAPIQHGFSRGPATDTRKGRRRNRPV